uniref:Uncharacterized protein n=1 Tax=Leersia perrieri TaxID=77586 RepID=A0A0D9WDL9_9ORYZ
MAGVESDELKVSSGKRKAESFSGKEEEEFCSHAAKRIDLSKSKAEEKSAPVIAGDTGQEDKKKMWLLPQEEVEWILAQSNEPVRAEYRELKRRNPSLVPSPEEEKDESVMLLYEFAQIVYDAEEEFANFQAWVRGEYARKGFVEVDYDYFAERAEGNKQWDQTREEVFGPWDFSSDSEDDDLDKLIKRKCRRFV